MTLKLQRAYSRERRPIRKANARRWLTGRLSLRYWRMRTARKRHSEPAWLTENRLDARRIMRYMRRRARQSDAAWLKDNPLD